MKGVKGALKTYGDPCATCGQALTPENALTYAKTQQGIRVEGYLQSYCRDCRNARAKQKQQANPEQHRARCRAYRARIREQTIAAYGGQCACCGERNPEFLALDHINGGGSKERREKANNTAQAIYRIARNAGYPKDRYRLLCHNCNCALGWYGYCPHQRDQNANP